ncbi:hypothetical protein BH23BAC1_BH23BAC1_04160 [soil metagenome]
MNFSLIQFGLLNLICNICTILWNLCAKLSLTHFLSLPYVINEWLESKAIEQIYADPNKHLYSELYEFLETTSLGDNYSSWVVLR